MLKEAVKADAGKVRLELLPLDAVAEVGKVMTFGAKKYEPRNWEKGMAWGRFFGAAMRHMFDWWMGVKRDPETGLSPLAHAACDLLFLLAYELRGTQGDDRPSCAQPPLPMVLMQQECLHLPIHVEGGKCTRCGLSFEERN